MKATSKHRSFSALDPGKGLISVAPDNAELTFAQVMAPVIPELQKQALALTRRESEASDLLQSTRERAWKHIGSLSRYDNVSGWSFIVMRRLFVDEYRKSRSRPTSALDECLEFAAPASERRPLWTRFTLEDVTRALPALSPTLREPFRLHEFEGLSYREIATRLEIPVATVGTRLMRARSQVRALLLENGSRTRAESRARFAERRSNVVDRVEQRQDS
jgi:RNA polymerase sigma-70 factor (ECF subfamily)